MADVFEIGGLAVRKVVPVIMRRSILPAGPSWSSRLVQQRSGRIFAMQQQIVFRQNAPPFIGRPPGSVAQRWEAWWFRPTR
jgi:hypothetical protein